jgi:prefoldin subunit 5
VADAALIALVVGALATVLLVAFVLVVQIGRIRALYEQASAAFGRLEAATEELNSQQQVLDRELAALGDAMAALRASRTDGARGDGRR